MTGRFCLVTRELAETDRAPSVRDFYARALLGLEMSPLSDVEFDIDMSVVQLDRVVVAHGSISPLTATRTSSLAADCNANFVLGTADRDFVTTGAAGESHNIMAGEILFMPLDQAFSWTFPEACVTTAIHLDRRALLSRVPSLDLGGVRCIPAGVPGSNLLFSYAKVLHQTHGVTPEAAALAAQQILDLAAFVINETNLSVGSNGGAGVRAERFLAAKRDVDTHFSDPTLSIHDVAARQSVTARYLQVLFDENGTTFTNYLQSRRLDFARARLRNASSPIRILDIALEAGFAELSTFNRLFRKRFGATPSSFKNGRQQGSQRTSTDTSERGPGESGNQTGFSQRTGTDLALAAMS